VASELVMTDDQIAKDRAGWHARRAAGITASEISAVLGLSPYCSPFALYVAKAGTEQAPQDSDAITRGTHLEPYVADIFGQQHPDLTVYPGGLYRSAERPWQLCTFDKLAVDGAGHLMLADFMSATRIPPGAVMPVQIKTSATKEGYGEQGTPDIPVHYRAQALYELDVAEAGTVLVPVLFMQEWKVVTYVIERNADVDADLAFMRKRAEEFLDRIASDDPPPIDWTASTAKALKTLHPQPREDLTYVAGKGMRERYRAARMALAKAEKRMGQASNELLAAMGDAKYAVFTDPETGREVKVATRVQYSRHDIDRKALRAKKPQIAKQFETETPVDFLTPGGWAR
jgi:putative phage-type endonuclease